MRRFMAVLIFVFAGWIGVSAWRVRYATAADPNLVIDPNTCPVGVLPALPRIGAVLASRIAAERDP